jgi:Na+-translocating ferredoxin:NAD+ oxidoreductase RnfA subunit
MIIAGDIVDWAALGEVVWVSFAAAIGVTIAFSMVIVGAVRFAEMRRAERMPQATLYALLGLVGLAITTGAIVAGIIVMTSK